MLSNRNIDGGDYVTEGIMESWQRHLRALEALGDVLPAVVDEQAEVDGEVDVDAQDVGLDGGAKAHGDLEVDQPFDEAAAGLLGRLCHRRVDQAVENIGAGAELERVSRALGFPSGARWDGARCGGWPGARAWLRRRRGAAPAATATTTATATATAATATGSDEVEEEEVEGEEDSKGSRELGGHGGMAELPLRSRSASDGL